MALMAGFDVAAMDPVGAEFIHHVVEAMKLAFADREAFYGDPDFTDVPMATLLSPAYTDARRALIGATRTTISAPAAPMAARRAPTTPPRSDVRRTSPRRWVRASPPSRASGASGGDTCHVDVIDRHGNMVSATPSAGWLQSSPADSGTWLLPRLALPDVLAG